MFGVNVDVVNQRHSKNSFCPVPLKISCNLVSGLFGSVSGRNPRVIRQPLRHLCWGEAEWGIVVRTAPAHCIRSVRC